MKIIFKFFLILFFLLLILITYLSIFGVETDKFNSQILNKIKKIDDKIELDLKKIRLVLDPFKFRINIKTIGSKLKIKNKKIEIENIKAQVSLKSLISNKFSIENLEVSTKSLEIKNLISFIRYFQNSPELFILEKTVNKGYLIADIKLEFDNEGKIKNNLEISGLIKNARLSFLKKYNINNLNLFFNYKDKNLLLNEILFQLNNLNFFSEKILLKKIKNDLFVEGKINNKKFDVDKKNLNLLVKPFFPQHDIGKLKFSSNNSFSFIVSNKFKFSNFKLISDIVVDELSIINSFSLKNFFPKIKDRIIFLDNKLSINYKKNNLEINGKGDILYQDNKDSLNYLINKNQKDISFKSILKINNNPLLIDFLNYKKNEKVETLIELQGSQTSKNIIFLNSLSLNEGKNKIQFKDLNINKKFEIIELDSINLDYIDKDKQRNIVNLNKKKDAFYLKGAFFNANRLIDNLLLDDDKNSKFFNINSRIFVDINKIQLDNENLLSNFVGEIFYEGKEITKANLAGDFLDNKKFKFTINTEENSKITTLFIDKAEPIVRRYKFIKGFEGGSLDFYSTKKFNQSISQLKIYDFRLKELPVLTKILTLASLQGIADILSGEGIRFQEFEMNFKNKGNLMTIDEIYTIGPAISILMDGYVEKNKLISLRGTLVPATTINKFIGSLPVLGKILVGSKTGEGVFGVSFKIKGPPKKLETTVNPIKTLTPRFITRTIEKIKKN